MNAPPPLYSHYQPRLRLEEHLVEVGTAARYLLMQHSRPTRKRRPATPRLLDALIRCHDLGKGSPAFQDYIQDPEGYLGAGKDPEAKAHTALSASLAILWAAREGWPPLHVLLLAQAVAGHHSGFASLDALRDRLRPDDGGVREEQWARLDLDALSAATGLDLEGIGGRFRDGGRWLFRRQRAKERLAGLDPREALGYRLWVQFLFSILLEADKAFLALRAERLDLYLRPDRPHLSPGLVDRRLGRLPRTPLDPLRRRVREEVLSRLEDDHPCHTLTLPTGVGKTLLAATWALEQRRRLGAGGERPPRIVLVLPFLSIIDQMEREYRDLLGLNRDSPRQTEMLMASHSLSYREYELEGETLGQDQARFFLDTWRSEVVVTTFDQLLLALFSPRSRHLMRFHALMDAVIVLDEIQTLPCRLWDLVDHGLRGLTREGRTRILMMSATQPALLSGARELAGGPAQVAEVFSRFRRYRVRCRHQEDLDLQDFIEALQGRLEEWIAAGRRPLITLNTRASARAVWEALAESADGRVPVFLISADVNPRDRLAKIAEIKRGKACIVVSTQTIEAGVDIDMDLALRDFAPLDAIIQIAGRCNRNDRLGDHGGEVELYSLRGGNGRFADRIYDQVLLTISREILKGLHIFDEGHVFELSRRYFEKVKARMDIGAELTRRFRSWEDWDEDIQTLLRGERREQVCLVTADGDERTEVQGRIEQALRIEDRWDRREMFRRLAPALQELTVCLYARPGFHPEDYADPVGPYWLLRSGHYTPEAGLDLGLEEKESACIL